MPTTRTGLQRQGGERTLAANEQQSRLALAAANQGLYDLEVQTGRMRVSDTYARMLGYDPADFTISEARWVALLHPDDRDQAVALYRAYLEGRLVEYRSEYRLRTADGGWKWLLSLGGIVERAADGRPLRMCGTHTDITREKLNQTYIRWLTRLYATLSQTGQTMVLARSRAELLREVCRIAVEQGDPRMAWIGLIDAANGRVSPAACFGEGVDSLERLTPGADAGPVAEQELIEQALRSGEPVIVNDLATDPRAASWREALRDDGFAALAVLPIREAGALAGTLNLYSGKANFFNGELVALLQRLALDVSAALDRFRLETERQRAERLLRESSERLQHLSWRLLSVQEEERRALARELHDDVGQQLAALKLNLGVLGRDPSDPANQRRHLDCLEITDHILEQIRDAARNLRPSVLDDMGLPAALHWYARRQAERAGCEIVVEDRCPPLPAEIETAAFRIVQEAVNNAIRHGGARRITIVATVDDRRLSLAVRDDGSGFDPKGQVGGQGAGMGLSSMRERAELMGGRFTLGSQPGAGTTVEVTIPLPETE